MFTVSLCRIARQTDIENLTNVMHTVMKNDLVGSLEWNDKVTHVESELRKLKLKQQERWCTISKLRSELRVADELRLFPDE